MLAQEAVFTDLFYRLVERWFRIMFRKDIQLPEFGIWVMARYNRLSQLLGGR
jgi:hypothetical protein